MLSAAEHPECLEPANNDAINTHSHKPGSEITVPMRFAENAKNIFTKPQNAGDLMIQNTLKKTAKAERMKLGNSAHTVIRNSGRGWVKFGYVYKH